MQRISITAVLTALKQQRHRYCLPLPSAQTVPVQRKGLCAFPQSDEGHGISGWRTDHTNVLVCLRRENNVREIKRCHAFKFVCVCVLQYGFLCVWARDGKESFLLLCSYVAFFLCGAWHSCHFHVVLQFREGQTQVHALDSNKCAPL